MSSMSYMHGVPFVLITFIQFKAALAAGADFLGNFLVVEITPVSVRNIGYRTYIIWAVCNLANAVIVWTFYPETAAIPLEQIDMLFTDRTRYDEIENPAFYRKLQWSVVGKASNEVKRQRRLRKTGAEERRESAVVRQDSMEKNGDDVEKYDDKSTTI